MTRARSLEIDSFEMPTNELKSKFGRSEIALRLIDMQNNSLLAPIALMNAIWMHRLFFFHFHFYWNVEISLPLILNLIDRFFSEHSNRMNRRNYFNANSFRINRIFNTKIRRNKNKVNFEIASENGNLTSWWLAITNVLWCVCISLWIMSFAIN